MSAPHFEHVLVLGGGIAGLCAALAVSPHAASVTVVEQDAADADPAARPGVPHARHTHTLSGGGARALDQLAPGTTEALYAAGAQHCNMTGRYLGLIPQGWHLRYQGAHFIICASRALLEATVRRQVHRLGNVTRTGHTRVTGLTGGTGRITGATVLDGPDLAADLVVDATGRRSVAPRWLAELGFPEVPEDRVDPGIFYASAAFRAPRHLGADFPVVNVQTGHLDPGGTRRGGVVVPIEDGLWMVTLAGGPGSRPTTDDEGFRAFAAGLPHPSVAQLINLATPLGPAFGFRADPNRLRHYERLRPVPTGFLALGDAYATFNPVYGHGMGTAALSALNLRTALDRGRTSTKVLQRAIARASHNAWDMATALDLRYAQTKGPRPGRLARVTNWVQDRVGAVGAYSQRVAEAQLAVFTLATPASRMVNRHVLLAAITGPKRGGLTEPPWTPEELRALNPS